MIMHRFIRYCALALATVPSFSPVIANAASHPHRYHRYHYAHGAYPPYGYRAVAPQSNYDTSCVPWCQLDNSPCDPPYFKQADNRCSGTIW
jgi:hypothetical protein